MTSPTDTMKDRRTRVFNSAFETGLRSLIILTENFPAKASLKELVLLDYIVVHAADFGGPFSLHPDVTSKEAEILVRRGVVQSGLMLMGTRKLILRSAAPEGFRYQAGDEAGSFIDLLKSEYVLELRDCARWLIRDLLALARDEFDAIVTPKIQNWSSEFQSAGGAVS